MLSRIIKVSFIRTTSTSRASAHFSSATSTSIKENTTAETGLPTYTDPTSIAIQETINIENKHLSFYASEYSRY
jgi:hypothetical protein